MLLMIWSCRYELILVLTIDLVKNRFFNRVKIIVILNGAAESRKDVDRLSQCPQSPAFTFLGQWHAIKNKSRFSQYRRCKQRRWSYDILVNFHFYWSKPIKTVWSGTNSVFLIGEIPPFIGRKDGQRSCTEQCKKWEYHMLNTISIESSALSVLLPPFNNNIDKHLADHCKIL
jgi:hypothetical protein